MKEDFQLPLCSLLDNIRSLFNVGAVFRSSDAVRLEKLLIGGYTGCPPRNEISKVALGAEDSVAWEKVEDSLACVLEYKKRGYQIIALETGPSAVDLYEFEPKWPCLMILGNEVDGVSTSLLEVSDKVVQIPQYGLKESLNVANAFSVAAFEFLRKYRHQK